MRWAALFFLLTGTASAQTPCPNVIDNVSILNVVVTGSPVPIQFAAWDQKTKYVTVTYFSQQGDLFLGVPQTQIQNGTIAWSYLSRRPRAIMQERSRCPVTTEGNAPIQVQP